MKRNMNSSTLFEKPFEKVPDFISTGMRFISLLIVVLNTAVFACLVLKKATLPHVYWIQMICLSFNDILAGLSSFMVAFIDFPAFSQSLPLCCGTLAFFISSQAATLYNILIICVRRLKTINNTNNQQIRISQKSVAIITTTVCGVSFIFCLLPFLIWSQKDASYIKAGCSMETAFGENLKNAMKILFATFLVPLLCTNAIYCVVLFILRHKWKKTQPAISVQVMQTVASGSSNSSDQEKKSSKQTSSENSNCYSNLQSVSNLPSVDRGTSTESGPLKNSKYSKTILLHPPLVRQFTSSVKANMISFGSGNKDASSNRAVFDTLHNNKNHKASSKTFMERRKTDSETLKSSSTTGQEHTIIRSTMRIQKAYTLLGIVLVLLNVFTWPGVVVLMMEANVSSWSLTRPVKFPLFTTVSWNAVVNPILYTIQIKEFRMALFDMVRSYCAYLRRICRCTSQARM